MIARLFAVLVVGASSASTPPSDQHGTLTYTGNVTCAQVEAFYRKMKVKPLPCHEVRSEKPNKSNQDNEPNDLGH